MLGRKPEVVERMTSRVGIKERGWLGEGQGASYLAKISVSQALEMAGVDIKDIKAMTVATGLPDYMGVPTGSIITKELSGNYKIATMDVSGACPGFIHALRTAYTDLTSEYGTGGPLVCVAAEPASKGVSTKTVDTFLIFGDGSGAVVMDLVDVNVPEGTPKATFDYQIDPYYLYDLYVPTGGSVNPKGGEDTNCIRMNGKVVKEQAVRRLCEISESVLSKAKLSLGDIDLFIPHQANLEIIEEAGAKLGIPREKVFVNIQRYGNTSAASIPIAMREAWEEGRLKNGNIVLAATFGAGLNFAGAILPMNGLPEQELKAA